VSILINAAGLIHSGPLVDIAAPVDSSLDIQGFRRVLDCNLTTTWVATSLVVRRMVATRTRGVVVSLSSVAAAGNIGQGAYSAAKAGINAATSAWAKELGPLGIRFVAVAPGFIDTPSTHQAMRENILADWLRRTPTRSLGTTEDVVSAVLFAIENRHLSGAVLNVDGGLTV
jgi:3-oxoacyl-[acyl-carrier protein] reductase